MSSGRPETIAPLPARSSVAGLVVLEGDTVKITLAAARIKLGLQSNLTLGNLEASRDWGFAGDYIKAMWMMLQHKEPDDWVVATGKTYTVNEFAHAAFKYVDLDYEKYIQSSQKYFNKLSILW